MKHFLIIFIFLTFACLGILQLIQRMSSVLQQLQNMNQGVQQQRKRFTRGVGKIGNTNQILDQLEHKLTGYHQRKTTQQQLLNSHDEPPIPTKTKNTFKLFNKTQTQNNNTKMQVNQLEVQKQGRELQGNGKVSQLLQQVEAIEQLVRKKLALKEERCSQLQRQIELQKEQKLHLYKINTQLQQQLAKITTQNQELDRKSSVEEKELQQQLERWKKLYEEKKTQNRKLKQQEEVVKRTLKQSQKNQKIYHEGEIKVIKNKSRSKLASKKEQSAQQQQYLRNLAGELDKLRKMVKQKLKKSVSKR